MTLATILKRIRCQNCNKSFKPRSSATKYCSRSCYSAVTSSQREGKTDSVAGNTRTITANYEGNEPRNEKELMDRLGVDPLEWRCDSWEAKSYVLTALDPNGDGFISKTMIALKVKLERNHEASAAKALIEGLLLEGRKKAPKPIRLARPKKTGVMLEVGPYDAHWGLQSWGRQTLGPNYTVDIATREWSNALDTLLGRIANQPLEKINLVIGNDMAHYDNLEQTTTKGTPQDADTRYHRLVEHLIAMLREQAERLAADVAPVHIVQVEGNHDRLTSWSIAKVLEAYFANNKNVTVDAGVSPIKFVRHGKCLVMLTHGDVKKPLELPLQMARLRRKDWGETTHHEVHVGHLHAESVRDIQGVTMRRVLAMTPACNWSVHSGYGHPVRGIEGFLWDAKDGLINQPRVVLPGGEEMASAA